MTLSATRGVLVTACLLALAISYAETKDDKGRSRNGVRLVGGSASKGRLEVSSTAYWLTNGDETVAWRPVCEDPVTLSEGLPDVFCKLLGFQYGRKYYKPSINYREPNDTLSFSYDPVGYVYCSPTSTHRGLRAALQDPAATQQPHQPQQQLEGGRAASRSLLAPLTGMVDIPKRAKMECSFRLGDCRYPGPLVGLQCSNTPLPPAPPPPPAPPSPPPAPPPGSESIQLYGGGYNPRSPEPNLCPSEEYCSVYGRVEVLVSPPGGGGEQVWAPLCAPAPEDVTLTYQTGELACWQATNAPRFAYRPEFTVRSNLPDQPLAIPQEPVEESAAGLFNPAAYSFWATVRGGDFDKAARLQDMDLQVSSEPCASGALFAVQCIVSAK